MKIIVDANIVFSAILNTNSKIADILMNSDSFFEFIASDYLKSELTKYHKKISRLSKIQISEVEKVQDSVTKHIRFISEILIPSNIWVLAEDLCEDVDLKDTPYIAFSLFYNAKIWSGDKILQKGLALKGFTNFISINELIEFIES